MHVHVHVHAETFLPVVMINMRENTKSGNSFAFVYYPWVFSCALIQEIHIVNVIIDKALVLLSLLLSIILFKR